MSILIIASVLILWLFLGYKVYGSFIEKKVIQIDKTRTTPAREMNDGIDYSPAKKPLLFGHHFSSIAGAGPILGPCPGWHANRPARRPARPPWRPDRWNIKNACGSCGPRTS